MAVFVIDVVLSLIGWSECRTVARNQTVPDLIGLASRIRIWTEKQAKKLNKPLSARSTQLIRTMGTRFVGFSFVKRLKRSDSVELCVCDGVSGGLLANGGRIAFVAP